MRDEYAMTAESGARRRRGRSGATVFLIALLAAACGGDDGGFAMSDRATGAAGVRAEASAEGFQTLSAPAAAPAPAPAGQATRPRMLIRTGHATLEVDALDDAVDAVRRLVERAGGHVTNVGIRGGRDETRTASMTLRVPAASFDETLAALDAVGDVESVQFGSEDVGEQYADLEIRLANARRLEQRLLELLDTRTGSLEDVLAVERELARVREEIERMEATMRGLRDRVDLSTLTLELHEPEPLFSTGPGENVLTRALRQAGRNFVGLVGGFIASLGVVIPVGLILALAWWLWRRRRARRARARALDG